MIPSTAPLLADLGRTDVYAMLHLPVMLGVRKTAAR